MLEVDGLVSGYGRAEVLHGVDIHVNPGECVGLLGLNGAGKSTLLSGILGLVPTWAGSVSFEGVEITALPSHRRVRMGAGLVHEERQLFSALTVSENLRVGLGRRSAASALAEVFSLFPVLSERRNQVAGTLSGGEQQMLAISRALVRGPRFLMLDEPSLGLAPLLVDGIYRQLAALRERGLSMLIVEQHVGKVAAICDRLYVLDSGQLTFAGTPAELQSHGDIASMYLGTEA